MRIILRLARWFVLAVAFGIVIAATSSLAAAPVVTFKLSPNDDGFGNNGGTSTPGWFAIYADVSPDNGGLFSFSVDLAGNITSIINMAPQGQFRKSGSLTRFLGFGAGVSEDTAAGKISGLPDLAKGGSLIPVYGFGQVGGDLNTLKPVGYNNYFDTNPNGVGSIYNAHLLLGIGQYQGSAAALGFDIESLDNSADVYDDCTGTEHISASLVLNKVVLAGGSLSGQSASFAQDVIPCAAVPEPGVILLTLSAPLMLFFRTRRPLRG